jgi:ribonuclease R
LEGALREIEGGRDFEKTGITAKDQAGAAKCGFASGFTGRREAAGPRSIYERRSRTQVAVLNLGTLDRGITVRAGAAISSYNGMSMPRSEPLSDDEILSYLNRSTKPASLRQIAAALGLRHANRRALAKSVTRLKRRKVIEEVRAGCYRLAGTKSAKGEERHRRREATSKLGGDVAVAEPGVAAAGGAPGAGRDAGRDPNLVTGRLVAHHDGYGFVVPESPRRDLDGDLFIPPNQSGDAMHGDRVIAHIERRQPGREGAGRAEGRILRVLGRAHPTVVGVFRYGPRGNVVLPYEARLNQEIVIPPGDELTPELLDKYGADTREHRSDASGDSRGDSRGGSGGGASRSGSRVGAGRLAELDGAVVNVELTRFPHAGVPGAGRVIEVLGHPGEFGVDVEILIRKHHLPYRFPAEVLEEARRVALLPADADEADHEPERRDFRQLPIVTIDGETARDFDDAVYVERRGENWHLQVHIADVAHYVTRNGALDREARLRGTSVYFPDRAVPMLPEELSNGICSLKPHEDRLVMSVLLDLDSAGEVRHAEFTAGVIRSAERMTYTNVNRVLEGDAEAVERYAALAPRFRDMRDLALILNARRAQRGSMDFDLPERVLTFDAEGRMTGITRSERNIAHRLIEEFMLAANQAVARYLEGRGLHSLHRVHEKPDPKKVLEFEQLAQAFGYSLGVPGLSERRVTVRHGQVPPRGQEGQARRGGRRDGGRRDEPMVVSLPGAHEFQIRPQHYQRLTQKIAGKPEERILSYLMLRSLKQARYAVDPLGHFALAFDQYAHFTSPIRRYPDLVVHRVLKWALAHAEAAAGTAEGGGPYSRGELAAIALESSESERRAEGAERELIDWKTAQFMEQHLGEEYEALIISVQKFGFFVELMEIFVEGLVPMNRLEEEAGGHCFYRERDHAIVAGRGNRARIWKLGARVRVRAERIDPMRRRVEFALAT